MYGPLLPGTPVEPEPAVFHPLFIFELGKGHHDGIEAHAMCAVRVCQIAGSKYLMGLDGRHQLHNQPHILLPEGLFAHRARLVEGHIEKMYLIVRQAAESGAAASFAAADEPFDKSDFWCI